jgi:hypothetical protein
MSRDRGLSWISSYFSNLPATTALDIPMPRTRRSYWREETHVSKLNWKLLTKRRGSSTQGLPPGKEDLAWVTNTVGPLRKDAGIASKPSQSRVALANRKGFKRECQSASA